ncbi:MAG: ribosome-associated translation inhibitor RaiA [Rickettsia endosymbiont of Bryobia graminum]|nr:ribosome-associated translation inhibitor RaiA [Rickettsia endosymbiont of Bryobia graminum]
MQISITGQHISVGESLNNYVKNRILQVTEKYFNKAISAHIHFVKQASSQYVCDIIVNDGSGRHIVLKANSVSNDLYSSFDIALSRLESQFRKYKSKLKDRHAKIKISEILPQAIKYVITPNQHEEDDNNLVEDNPTIIAEKPTEILKLSVSEAVMKMDLENLPALMFQNIKTDRINVVYYRKDGNISWIDSNS